MWRKTAIALIALIILVSIAVFVIASEAALVWAVNRAAERSGGKLSASGVTGSLLYGPIQFSEIRYRTPSMDVVAQRARIDPQRWQLLKREVVLNDVEADNITVVRHSAETESGRPPATLRTAFP